MVNIILTAGQRCFLNLIGSGTLGSHKKNLALPGYYGTNEIKGIIKAGNSLVEIDDMNTVPGAVNILLHLGIPVTGLMAEMNTGIEHFAHGNVRHFNSL